jgi:uncharacterized phage protein gp47/JayE
VTSPDIQGYVDLTIYDVGPGELVDRALLDAEAKMPDWQPREGNTEMVLLEALAVEVSELVYSLNRVPSGVLDGLLLLYGVERSLGTPPTATATFTLTAPTGYQLPVGTTVRLDLGGEEAPLEFTTDAAVTVPQGATSVTAAITATRATDAANAQPAGTALAMVTPIPYVDRVELATAVSGGTGPEDDVAYRNRGVQRLARLVSTLVRPDHFTADALETVGVYRAMTLDNWNVTAAGAGHVTVAALGLNGALLSTAAKDDIQARLDSRAQTNLAVHVIDPTITAVDVTVTVKALDGYDAAAVTANVQARLDAYLSPDTWGWGGTVRRNELIAQIDRAEGVDYVVTLDAPTGDVALAGAAPLADLGLLTVTVT